VGATGAGSRGITNFKISVAFLRRRDDIPLIGTQEELVMENNGFAFTSNPYKNYRQMVLWAKRNLEPGKSVDWSGGVTLQKIVHKEGREEIVSYRTGLVSLEHFWPMVIHGFMFSPHLTVADRKQHFRNLANFSKGKKFPLP
jgi:hypothetical protein